MRCDVGEARLKKCCIIFGTRKRQHIHKVAEKYGRKKNTATTPFLA
jgi:hypothetical protein